MYRVKIELKDGSVIDSKQMKQSDARDVWWTYYTSWGSKKAIFAKPVGKDHVFINSNEITAIWMEKEVKDETKSNENS